MTAPKAKPNGTVLSETLSVFTIGPVAGVVDVDCGTVDVDGSLGLVVEVGAAVASVLVALVVLVGAGVAEVDVELLDEVVVGFGALVVDVEVLGDDVGSEEHEMAGVVVAPPFVNETRGALVNA